MSSTMYDIQGQVVTNRDLQNKGAWCTHGENKENVFVRTYGQHLGLTINPKKETNRYAPDLAYLEDGGLADLKTQNTPFFTASRYNYDPQFTVTFNRNDADRYREEEPELDIYFWVNWVAIRYFRKSTFRNYSDTDVRVNPMHGVWKVSFQDLDTIIQHSPLHTYRQRVNDNQGNARESYLVDLNDRRIQRVI